MTRTRLLALTAAVALAGCAPPTTSRQAPTSPDERTADPPRTYDCSRQFDDNDAGFQTCQDGSKEPPTPK
jgi:hypothetical protein